jgi:hypothetical protein
VARNRWLLSRDSDTAWARATGVVVRANGPLTALEPILLGRLSDLRAYLHRSKEPHQRVTFGVAAIRKCFRHTREALLHNASNPGTFAYNVAMVFTVVTGSVIVIALISNSGCR